MPGTHTERALETAAGEVVRALQAASTGQDPLARAAAR